MKQTELHVIVLAAGKGTRMRSSRAKVCHPLAGKAMIVHVLEKAFALEPKQVHVVVGHQYEAVQALLEETFPSRLNFVHQEEQLGTGHAVAEAMPDVPEDACVLIVTADTPLVSTAALKELLATMAACELGVLTANMQDPTGLGRIQRNSENDIVAIVEEKDVSSEERKNREINSGIICAKAKQLRTWLKQLTTANAQQEYYLTDIFELAHSAGSGIGSATVDDPMQVFGINDRTQLAYAERYLQERLAESYMRQGVSFVDPSRVDFRGSVEFGKDCTVEPNVIFNGPCVVGNDVRVGANCQISASKIGDQVEILPNSVIEGAIIESNVSIGPFARIRPGTELAANVKIGNFVETKNARIAAGSKASHLSYIGDSEIGADCNIGAGVITANYDGANKHQTRIGDKVFVGSDSQLIAPIVVGDGATIGAGTTVTDDVDPGHLVVSRARQRSIPNWQRPKKKK